MLILVNNLLSVGLSINSPSWLCQGHIILSMGLLYHLGKVNLSGLSFLLLGWGPRKCQVLVAFLAFFSGMVVQNLPYPFCVPSVLWSIFHLSEFFFVVSEIILGFIAVFSRSTEKVVYTILSGRSSLSFKTISILGFLVIF